MPDDDGGLWIKGERSPGYACLGVPPKFLPGRRIEAGGPEIAGNVINSAGSHANVHVLDSRFFDRLLPFQFSRPNLHGGDGIAVVIFSVVLPDELVQAAIARISLAGPAKA